jgi:hypothetical protein
MFRGELINQSVIHCDEKVEHGWPIWARMSGGEFWQHPARKSGNVQTGNQHEKTECRYFEIK